MNALSEFAAVFVALYVGHSVADHWVQTSCQAIRKGERTRAGQLACLRHVATLSATKWLLVLIVVGTFHVKPVWWQLVLGLLLDAGSHYWADRRFTLERLARHRLVGKGEFYDQGTDLVNAEGNPSPHTGTGRYALDQSWHHLWLFIGAWVATVPLS
jgi:hypothetical protein